MHIESPAFPGTESQLTQQVQDRLQSSPYLLLRRISCELSNENLTLCGTLPSFYFKQLAQEAVSDLAGPWQIDNQITVSYPA